MKSKGWVIGIILLLMGGSLFYVSKQKKRSNARHTQITQIVQVERGSVEDVVEATGEVIPMNRVEIKPPISGRIESLLAEEGSYIRSGSVLAWMSSSDRAAVLDAARAKGAEEYKRWQDTYKPTPVVAPLSGSVILRNGVVGQTVDTGSVLFAMSDRLIVQASVDESDIGRIKVGMKAMLTLDAYPDQRIQGEVFQILQEGKNVSNVITYGVKVRPIKIPSFFRAQMTANVRFIIQQKESVLRLPTNAITADASGNKQVMRPAEKGQKPTVQSIETGISAGDQTEIVSGLVEGDSVVITQRRYTPQQAPQSSPLTMGNQRGGGGQGGSGNNRQRSSGQ